MLVNDRYLEGVSYEPANITDNEHDPAQDEFRLDIFLPVQLTTTYFIPSQLNKPMSY